MELDTIMEESSDLRMIQTKSQFFAIGNIYKHSEKIAVKFSQGRMV